MYSFDPLTETDNLQHFGFSEPQAKGLIKAITLSQIDLAKKQDVTNLRKEFIEFKEETRKGLSSTNQKISDLREEMRMGFLRLDHKIDNKIFKMICSLGIMNLAGMGGFVYLLKYFI